MDSVGHANSSGRNLVIFGCGYVGSAVADVALSRGIAVTALTRNEAKAAELRARGIRVVVAELQSSDWHAEIPGGADYVLNAVSSGGGGVAGYRQSYLEGMRSIVCWAQSRGAAGTFVYTSSTSVYPQSGGVEVDESAPVGGSARAEILVAAERELMSATGTCQRWFVLRLAGIYGPGRHHLLTQVRTGTVLSLGEYHLNLVHRDDINSAVWACFEAPPSIRNRVFNVADDSRSTKAQIVAWLSQRLQVPPPHVAETPPSGHRNETADRVVTNVAMVNGLRWKPRFPTYREGFENVLAASAPE